MKIQNDFAVDTVNVLTTALYSHKGGIFSNKTNIEALIKPMQIYKITTVKRKLTPITIIINCFENNGGIF